MVREVRIVRYLGLKRVDIATLVSLCVASGIGQPIYVSEETKIVGDFHFSP